LLSYPSIVQHNSFFLLWGMLHGFLLILERLGFARTLERIPRFTRRLYVMLSVMFGWALFRADTLPAAGFFLRALFIPRPASLNAQPLAYFINAELILVLITGVIGSSTIVVKTEVLGFTYNQAC
jgi:alginate O-acetyltransferase complex protein AlgI